MALLRSSRHPQLLRADDALLVVIDMQEPFLNASWERERVVKNVNILVRTAVLMGVPVVPTLQYPDRMGPVVPEVAKVLPSQCEPFEKMTFSCVDSDVFEQELRRSGRKQIVLCGVESHICVNQTAHDLLALGYQVHVVADAVSSRAQANAQLGIERAHAAGAIITSAEMFAFELLNEAGTPEFRQVLDLVK